MVLNPIVMLIIKLHIRESSSSSQSINAWMVEPNSVLRARGTTDEKQQKLLDRDVQSLP